MVLRLTVWRGLTSKSAVPLSFAGLLRNRRDFVVGHPTLRRIDPRLKPWPFAPGVSTYRIIAVKLAVDSRGMGLVLCRTSKIFLYLGGLFLVTARSIYDTGNLIFVKVKKCLSF